MMPIGPMFAGTYPTRHSNSWRNMRINSAEFGNVAYIEYDNTFQWVANSTTGSGLQFYEYYNITADPYQMTNLMAGPSPAIGGAALAALRGNLTALRTCVGTIACSSITMPSLTQ